MNSITSGLPEFFSPNPMAFLGPKMSLGADDAGHNSTEPLQKTRNGLHDPALLATQSPRMTLGAANVTSGEMPCFDTKTDARTRLSRRYSTTTCKSGIAFAIHLWRRQGEEPTPIRVVAAWAPTVAIFAALRVAQGLCMATAFSQTLACLGERTTGAAATQAFGADVTGNVASNLIGRFVASGVAGAWGIDASFHLFAGLNLAGAALVAATIHRTPKMKQGADHARSPLTAVKTHPGNPWLRAAFASCSCSSECSAM